jgi:hypothetical protein
MAEHRSCCSRSISLASRIAILDRMPDAEAKEVYLQRKRPSANSDALVLWRLAVASSSLSPGILTTSIGSSPEFLPSRSGGKRAESDP